MANENVLPQETHETLKVSKSSDPHHSPKMLLIGLGAFLIIIIGGGIGYFLGVNNSEQAIPANTNQVTQQSSPTPSPMAIPTVDPSITANWKTYSNSNISYTFKYPQEVILIEENMITLTSKRLSQEEATELQDGIGLQFSLPHIIEGLSLKEYTQKEMEKYKENADIIKSLEETSIGSYAGYTFTTVSLGEIQYIYLQNPNNKNEFVYIKNYNADSNNKVHQETVNKILATFKFTN